MFIKGFRMQAEISYDYLRGTTDEGNYLHPSRVMINKRKLGPLAVSTPHSSLAGLEVTSNLHKESQPSRLYPEMEDLAVGPRNSWKAGQAHFATKPLAAIAR